MAQYNQDLLNSRGLKITPATIEDLPDLVELVANLLDEQAAFTSNRRKHERGIRLILENPSRGRIIALRNEDHVIGMANLLFTISTAQGGFVILLEDVIMHPDYRDQGLGSHLVDYVIDFAKQKDFKRINLLADTLSERSHNFFARLGFEHCELSPMRLVLSQ